MDAKICEPLSIRGQTVTRRDAFTAEEWAEIALAPMLASLAVTAADPSGLVGTLRESSAVAWSMRAAKTDEDTLASAIVTTYETPEGQEAARDALADIMRARTSHETMSEAIARLGRIARLVDERTPGEATAFKAWISVTALAVAEATREGGILGFGGGERVSEAERRTLASIDSALGLPAA